MSAELGVSEALFYICVAECMKRKTTFTMNNDRIIKKSLGLSDVSGYFNAKTVDF